MERNEQNSTLEAICSPLRDPGETQLDFFHKLGYSTEQVFTVLRKFGLNMDTNRILGELVQTAAGPEEMDQPIAIATVPGTRGDGASDQLLQTVPQHREETTEDKDALRPIVIDGSNVAMSHGNKAVFSCLGIQLAVRFFLDRGHTDITVFVPSWRREQPRPDVPITDQQILRDLERKKILVFTPSRRVAGKRVVCYDDRFIVKLAYESDGIIVSNDTYRDLQGEKPEWKRFIEEKLLMYSFVNDKFMPPDDPLGRHGPTLDNFLRKVPKIAKKLPCPYGKKCTYGIKCKFHHHERTNQSARSLADELREKARLCSSPHKSQPAASVPGPPPSISLEDDFYHKLTLDHCSSSLKKGHTSENVLLVKGGHRSSRRAQSVRKSSRHSPSELETALPSSSQEQLDSGLGSIESQSTDVPWEHGEHRHGTSYRNRSIPAHYSTPPSLSSPSCTCSCGPPSLPASPCVQQHSCHHSVGSASAHSPDLLSYFPRHYPGYGAPVYPVSMHAYSQGAEFQHSRAHPAQGQVFWSDPYGAYPQTLCSAPVDMPCWEPRQRGQPGTSSREREVIRKKLLAIFNARVVDKAMDLFPQVMDPQVLAAEILMLQSRDSALR